MKILMVCLGNICRSPLAEGILQNHIDNLNLDWEVDSAGTSGYHEGNKPDERSIKIAAKNNINISKQRSRKFKVSDFDIYDKIYVMDSQNYQDVLRLASNENDKNKVDLIMNELNANFNTNVPDPYWGTHGFEKVFSMLDSACSKIIEKYNV